MKKYSLLLIVCLLLPGCASHLWNTEKTVSSSLVDFLYPKRSEYKEHEPSIPHLTLPLNVGITFVPPSSESRYGQYALSAHKKNEILSRVKSEFLELDYVNRIEIISDDYLREGGSFGNLEQLSRLYDVQVMALISYDQVARNTQNKASLLYWTIAGMYLIPGDKNSTQTFLDTAVFDIDSNKMLFRAPGVSDVESLSTAVKLDETFYENSEEGFNLAAEDMIVNLNSELEQFKVRVKEEKVAKVSYSSDYRGGSLGWLSLIFIAIFALRRNMK